MPAAKRLGARIRFWLARLHLVFLGVAAALFLVEVAACWAPWILLPGAIRNPFELARLRGQAREALKAQHNAADVYTSLPERRLDQVGVPGISYEHHGLDFSAEVHYNSLGIRDREPSSLGPDRPTVLILGDSLVEGRELAAEETMARQLELALEVRGAPSRVVNAGMAGTGTVSQLHLLDYLGPAYRPKKVILLFNLGNDLRNNSLILQTYDTGSSTLRASRGFYWKREDEKEFSYVEPRTDLRETLGDSERRWLETSIRNLDDCEARSKSRGVISWIASHTAAYTLLRRRLGSGEGSTCYPEVEGIPLFLLFETERAAALREVERAWEVTGFLLARMDAAARATGAELLVAILPSRFRADRQARERTLRHYGLAGSFKLAEPGPEERLEKILKELGISSLDLTGAFKSCADLAPLFLPIDGHFSARGHAFVAAELEKLFSDSPPVKRHE